ncbi:MAG: hypothetical protein LBG94_04900 [Treponema sp.]|jgi:hypothetical protein|nr:hypothetical protein [Treponema sp.]
MIGVFSLKGNHSVVPVDVDDGTFTNLIDGEAFRVEGHLLSCRGMPLIFEVPAEC